ncbi:hypothetical protein [Chryseobacterium sp. A321]
MKKILLTVALGLFGLSSAQYYPSNGGNSQYESGWYGDEDHYFDEDYYYEYPDDYYVDDYYRSFYNDYRQSITRVNWNRLFRELRLNSWQANMVMDLNRQFPDYYSWNSYYRSNPNRWYYDRFYALEQILGPRAFSIYQSYYYNGRSPVQYYVNFWRSNYRPRYYSYYVVPRYRSVNINLYKINRKNYHRNVGTQYGWNQPRNSNDARFKSGSNNTLRNSSVNSSNAVSSRNSGFKSSTSASSSSQRASGLRTGTATSVRTEPRRTTQATPQRTSGLRTNTASTNSNVRSSSSARTSRPTVTKAPSRPTSNRSAGVRSSQRTASSSKAASSSSGSSSRTSGMRGSR